MKNYFDENFWELFRHLPPSAQKQANRAFEHLAIDIRYPSLKFKCVHQLSARYSIRIGWSYRALGFMQGDDMYWYWIGGDHNEYERKIKER